MTILKMRSKLIDCQSATCLAARQVFLFLYPSDVYEVRLAARLSCACQLPSVSFWARLRSDDARTVNDTAKQSQSVRCLFTSGRFPALEAVPPELARRACLIPEAEAIAPSFLLGLP
jgi:hypothetical protein